MVTDKKSMSFQTEVNQVLHLVINSLYSNKEIFLRELISNASDALDKLRFLALSNAPLYENDSDLAITVTFNEKLKTLTIKDNGIGMTYQDAIDHLGTIAKSGTKEFLNQLTGEQAKDSQLIGQFGVGFYSAFIVADKVTVKSRRAGVIPDEGIIWESKGDGTFEIAHATHKERGTEVILHLKDDAQDYLSDWRLRSIITKYSDHICWPIQMKKASEDDKSSESLEKINKATALWTLSKSEISDEEYEELYKHISHDYQGPLKWSHNHVEGKQQYISLLYIPSHAPFDLWHQDAKHGLKLYIKRVFIMDEATQFLPRYLRFVRGIIDASDLPLNVSREILQDNKQVESIRAASTKRVLSMLEKLSEKEKDQYQKFWNEFGQVLKEGPIEDVSNRETIAKLLRFSSTHEDNSIQNVSLSDYVSRMDEKQDKIYYLTASSYNAAKNSPHLEMFKKKGIEVLLLSDRIDEWLAGYLTEFEGKTLQSVSKGKLDIDEEQKEVREEKQKTMEPLLNHIKKILDNDVKDVVISTQLTDSPVCIRADSDDMSLEMQRILKSAGQQIPEAKPIFEINASHRLIEHLETVQDEERFSEWVKMLFEQALLAENGQLDNPVVFIRRMNQLLAELS